MPNREQILENIAVAKQSGYPRDAMFWQMKLDEMDASPLGTVPPDEPDQRQIVLEQASAAIALQEPTPKPKYVTLGDIYKELKVMKDDGMTKESLMYVIDRTF